MKYLKLLSISLLMFIFAIACQAGEDNRIVYDENTSDAYSETIEEGDKETTVLATVKNYGRMFPYISSIIMCIGILVHLLVMALSNGRRKNV